MGFIYKITNTINNKIYIGQTRRSVKERFNKHLYDCNRDGYDKYSLYRAMKKYGKENFIVETIEKVDNQYLDEREQYWISYYDSFKNGYNMTIGGKAVRKFSFSNEQIISMYHELKSARKVAEKIGCDHQVIDKILDAENVQKYSFGLQRGKGKVVLEYNNEKYTFDCAAYCAKWMIQNNISKTKNFDSVRKGIATSLKKNNKNNKDWLYCDCKIYYLN